MTTTSIRFEADLTTFDAQMEGVKQKLADVSNTFDASKNDPSIKPMEGFKEAVEQLKELIRLREELASKNAISIGSLEQSNQVLQDARRVAQRARASSRTFDDTHRSEYAANLAGGALDATQRMIQRRAGSEEAARLSEESRLAEAADELARAERLRDAESARQASQAQRSASAIAQTVSVFAGAALGGGGGMASVGSLAGGGMGGLAGGLLGGPPGAMIGNALGSAIGGKLGGMADSGLDDATKEAIAYSELRRQLGSTAVDFDGLRTSTRELTSGFNVTLNESAQLAKQFAHTAAYNPDDSSASSLGQAVRDAIGMAQGYGIDAQATTGFLATAQLYQVTNNESDNKRLALQIGEAVGKSGTTAKMDEVLALVARFTEQTATQSLLVPDVSAYTSLLSTLMGSTTPGVNKNPNTAASILNEVDSGIRGATSLPQMQFMESAFRRANMEFTARDLTEAKEAGGFANFSDVFGRESALSKLMLEKNGEDDPQLQHRDNLAQTTRPIKSILADALLHDTANKDGSFNFDKAAYYGVSAFNMPKAHVSEWLRSEIDDPGFGKTEAYMKGHGLDPKTFESSKLPVITDFALNDPTGEAHYQALLKQNKIKAEDKADIDKLKPGSDEFTDKVIRLVMADTGDTGLDAQQAQIDLAATMQEFAGEMIPLTTYIKEGITELIKGLPDFLTSDSAKAYVAMQDLMASGGQNFDKEPEYAKANSAKSLSNITETLGDSGMMPDIIEREASRAKYLEEMEKSHITPSRYVKGHGDILKKHMEGLGLLGSEPFEDAYGNRVSVPFSGVSLEPDGIPENVHSSIVRQKKSEFLDETFTGGIDPAHEGRLGKKLGSYADSETAVSDLFNAKDRKKAVEELKIKIKGNPENYDKNLVPFLMDYSAADNNEPLHEKYRMEKPAVEPPKVDKKAGTAPDYTFKNSLPARLQGKPGIDALVQSDGFSKLDENQRGNALLIAEEAAKQNNSEQEVLQLVGVGKTESSFNENAHNASGAHGLMQVMPGTADTVMNIDPYDPKQNVMGSIREINKQAGRFQREHPGWTRSDAFGLALATHHSGPGHDAYKQGRIPDVSDGNSTTKDWLNTVNKNAKSFGLGKVSKTARRKNLPVQAPVKPPLYGKTEQDISLLLNKVDHGPVSHGGEQAKFHDGFIPDTATREDLGDKIPSYAEKAEQERQQRVEAQRINIQHGPLSLNLMLTNPQGQPLTDGPVSTQFNAPRPAGW